MPFARVEDQPRRQIARIIHNAAHTAITSSRIGRASILMGTHPGTILSRFAPNAALGLSKPLRPSDFR
jgi:hypothetical protein